MSQIITSFWVSPKGAMDTRMRSRIQLIILKILNYNCLAAMAWPNWKSSDLPIIVRTWAEARWASVGDDTRDSVNPEIHALVYLTCVPFRFWLNLQPCILGRLFNLQGILTHQQRNYYIFCRIKNFITEMAFRDWIDIFLNYWSMNQ